MSKPGSEGFQSANLHLNIDSLPANIYSREKQQIFYNLA